MDNFTFYNPTRIIFGKETVGQIGGVIKEAGLSACCWWPVVARLSRMACMTPWSGL